MKRGEVLSAISKATEDADGFLEVVHRHRDRKDPFNVAEFFQSLPKKQHSVVWSSLLGLTRQCVGLGEKAEDVSASSNIQLSEPSLSLVTGVVDLLVAALSVENPEMPGSMRETVQTLHDVLLTSFEGTPVLQNRVSGLLEQWWCGEREGREGLVPHCLLYVIARTLNERAKLSDIKRVWAMRKALLLLDFEDPDTGPFKTMLLACTVQKTYLKTDLGTKFLSFLFGMHPSFVEDLHQTIKNQIPLASKSLLETYAEVYYRAWRLSSGPYLKQIEEHCLQDLMYSAVHAPRTGSHGLFHSLRKMLSWIHQQRSQKGVSEMLLRLYGPFLWRSLKVAHPHVRANAASLLLDAFPLLDPDSSREQTDQVMQKQFDVMMELLSDPSVLVRVTSISGVCRVLSLYFQLIPFAVMKSLLGRLVKELAWDAAANDIRVTVLQGLCVILENRLSHPLLKELLPLLHPLLHDKSEKVRLAFLELLIVVKGMKALKFYHICSIEQLLARMEVDSPHVVKRIVSLFVDAFKPSTSQKVESCVSLLRLNRGAARRFYQLAGAHLSPGEVVQFILAIDGTLTQCIKRDGSGQRGPGGGSRKGKGKQGEKKPAKGTDENTPDDDTPANSGDELASEIERAGWRKTAPPPVSDELQDLSQSQEPLSLADSDLMCGLLEVMAVLWEVAKDRLDKPAHQKVRKKLRNKMAKSLPLFFNTFTDISSHSALYLLAAHLPRDSVEPIAHGCLQTLASIQKLSSKTHDHTHLLIALVSWKQTDQVLELASRWLSTSLVGEPSSGEGAEAEEMKENHNVPKPSKRKARRAAAKKTAAPAIANTSDSAVLALDMLSWMMCHPVCIEELRKNDRFWDLMRLLKESMALLEAHHFVPAPSEQATATQLPFGVLRSSLSLYLRMCLHKRCASQRGGESEDEEEAWFTGKVKEVLGWCVRVLLPQLEESNSVPSPAASSTRQTSRKRKANRQAPPTPHLLVSTKAKELAEDTLYTMSEILLAGASLDTSLEREMAQVASSFATSSSGLSLLPSLCKLLYQLCEVSCHQEVDGITPGAGALSPSAAFLQAVLTLLHTVSLEDQPAFTKAWGTVRQCVTVALVASLRISSLSVQTTSSPHLLDTFTALVKTLVQAQLQHILTNPSMSVPSSTNDLPTFVGCVLKQVCKDSRSTCLFGSHLHEYLSGLDPARPQLFLLHHSSLHLIHVLAKGKAGGVEFAGCVRCSLKLLETLSEEDTQRWNGPISDVRMLVEAVQERLYAM